MFCGSNRMIQTNQFSLIVNQSACWLCAHHYPPRLSLFSLETSRVQLLPCPRRAAHRRRRSTGRTAWVFSVELLFCLSRPRHILDAESCPKFLTPIVLVPDATFTCLDWTLGGFTIWVGASPVNLHPEWNPSQYITIYRRI